DSVAARAVAGTIRKNVLQMAGRFIAGDAPEAALPGLRALWEEGIAHSVDLLGEATVSEAEAEAYQRRYLELVEVLGGAVSAWPERPALERDDRGALPRANVSVKLSALYSQLDPIDVEGSVAALGARLRP